MNTNSPVRNGEVAVMAKQLKVSGIAICFGPSVHAHAISSNTLAVLRSIAVHMIKCKELLVGFATAFAATPIMRDDFESYVHTALPLPFKIAISAHRGDAPRIPRHRHSFVHAAPRAQRLSVRDTPAFVRAEPLRRSVGLRRERLAALLTGAPRNRRGYAAGHPALLMAMRGAASTGAVISAIAFDLSLLREKGTAAGYTSSGDRSKLSGHHVSYPDVLSRLGLLTQRRGISVPPF